ncbi:FMNH2-utilizing monooxygenase [Frankia canadensis]|uniref:FMNH2-utilizing monooxygenase n=1 Tax=Frankia canadensis TaxID=1836972 RepID=A0A2I2KRP0_9ACTN|nr:LLM class flavin-dependent oxidoreductase [Frankia canadensis]SNQ48334.1 FMNH2-utilizing monooxygenase [Frankia canadensis]SOU55624.1 FMNH2-utilizing monooxygenase [Frankia canadensis]
MTTDQSLHLAVALNDAGWHPAAWRAPDARPADLFTAAYWQDLAREAERGLLDFVTIEDSSEIQSVQAGQPDDRHDQVRGRLDPLLAATTMALATSSLGIVPSVTTRTDPYRLATGLATLDHLSGGRAGWRTIAVHRGAAGPLPAHREPRPSPPRTLDNPEVVAYLRRGFAAGSQTVDLVRQLWDTWGDDALVRQPDAGWFVDPAKVRALDITGDWFSVDGPATTPRPPQGHPVVITLSHTRYSHEFAARSADLAIVTPPGLDGLPQILADLREQEATVPRPAPLRVYADLLVLLEDTQAAADERRARLDELNGTPLTSDALIFTGTPGDLADLLHSWRSLGVTGFRLRPAALPHDLLAITQGLVPELRDRGVLRSRYGSGSLRERLGIAAAAPARLAAWAS